MIHDLINMGIDEPYRMFTSRAEHRLVLRQDNTFLRLTEKAYHLGMIEEEFYVQYKAEKEAIMNALTNLRSRKNQTEVMRIYGQDLDAVQTLLQEFPTLSERGALTVHAEIRYEPYIKREEQEIKRFQQYKNIAIPEGFKFTDLAGLSKELQEKLNRHKPKTIAEASLIPGMTPAAISLLIFRTRIQK